MDGVGKSTTCELLAKKTGYTFVEKPLHYLFDETDDSFSEYIRIRDKVNDDSDRVFTSWFYGLGSIYMYDKFKGQNIITDRHFASNFAWSGTEDNGDVYDLLVKKLGAPNLTVILYAPTDVIVERLTKRNKKDSDLARVQNSETIYKKMIDFCEEYQFPFIVIDTSTLNPNEVVDRILEKLK